MRWDFVYSIMQTVNFNIGSGRSSKKVLYTHANTQTCTEIPFHMPVDRVVHSFKRSIFKIFDVTHRIEIGKLFVVRDDIVSKPFLKWHFSHGKYISLLSSRCPPCLTHKIRVHYMYIYVLTLLRMQRECRKIISLFGWHAFWSYILDESSGVHLPEALHPNCLPRTHMLMWIPVYNTSSSSLSFVSVSLCNSCIRIFRL